MRFLPLAIGLSLSLGLLSTGCNEGDGSSSGTTATASGPSDDGGSGNADDSEVIATVNGVSITADEFETAAARKTPENGKELSADEKQEVLDRLIAEKLLYKQALGKGLDKDPKVQKVMVNTLLREDVYANVRNSDFTDEELQAYFETNKDEFVVPEKVQIKRILIKVSDERSDDAASTEAGRIRGELKSDGSNFKEIAAKYSEDPYRRRGGDVGFVPKTGKPGLDPQVVEKAFELETEQISEPFRTSEGFNIVYVANRRERVERTFQQMKGSVLRKVKNERLKTLYEDYVSNLRTGADVQVNQDKLAAIEISKTRKSVGPGFAIDPAAKGLTAPEGDGGPLSDPVEGQQ